jgi:hypothetical protein
MKKLLLATIAAVAVLVAAQAHALDEKTAYETALTPNVTA